MSHTAGPRKPKSPSRRTLLRSGAWATPVVAAAAAAPTYAASINPCSTCPDISFGTGTPTGTQRFGTSGSGRTTITNSSGVTWTYRAPASVPVPPGTSNYGFVAPTSTGIFAGKGVYFESAADPRVPGTISITSSPVTRNAACDTITIGIVDLATATGTDPVLTVSFAGVPCLGTYETTVGNAGRLVDEGDQTWFIPFGAPLTGSVVLNLTYPATGVGYDDIDLYLPALGCAST